MRTHNLGFRSQVKPLSHKGSALAGFYINAERRGERGRNKAGTPSNAMGNPRTPKAGVS